MCECFEAERQRTDEELTRREDELAFLATHDALTGLPNRTLILDRADRVVLLEAGRIAGDGTHRELLAGRAYRSVVERDEESA